MTTDFHTPIATGAAANAAIFNSPLSSLDTAVSDNRVYVLAHQAELAGSRGGYGSLGARLDAMVFSGGNIATITDGAASAGQKIVDVDSTTGFVAGAYVAYALAGGALEYNLIDEVTSSTRLTLTTNIGTGGIANDTYISMISTSEYQAASAINHSGSLTLPDAMEYAAGGVYNVLAYGATGDGATDDTAAIQAAWAAMSANDTMTFPAGSYLISDTLDFSNKNFVGIIGNGAYIKTKAGSNFSNKAMIDLAGSGYVRMSGLIIVDDLATNNPEAGLVLGRTTEGGTGGASRFYAVDITGTFSAGALYNVGAEVCSFVGCSFTNYATGADVVFVGNHDPAGLTDTDAGMLTAYFSHCQILNLAGEDGGGRALQLNGRCSDINLRDCYLYTPNDAIVIETTGTAGGDTCYNLVLSGLRIEATAGTYTNYRVFKNTGSASFVTLENVNTSAEGGYILDVANTMSQLHCRQVNIGTGGKLLNIAANKTFVKSRLSYQGASQITVGAGATLADIIFDWYDNEWPIDSSSDYGEFVHFARTFYTKLGVNDATPSVAVGDLKHFYTTNTSPTTITMFDDGFDGQEIWVIFGDNNTTIDFYPSGSIYGNSGVDRAMAQNDMIHAIYYAGAWHCFVMDFYT